VINSGLSHLRLSAISKGEAVRILSVTTSEIVVEDGMSVSQLDVLLDIRARSVAVVDLTPKQAHQLHPAKYKDSRAVVWTLSSTVYA